MSFEQSEELANRVPVVKGSVHNVPVVRQGSVPVKIAAKVYGKDPAWVRAGLVTGFLPIGHATRKGKQICSMTEVNSRYGRINYYISPTKLYEDTGFIWKGEREWGQS